MKTDQSNEARITACIGSTGSGKGVYIKNYWLKKSDKRLLIWDYMREYAPFVTQVSEKLGPVIESLKEKQFQAAFLPSYDDKTRAQQFDIFCKAAVHAGDVALVVEELSFVTSPSFAPAGWKMVSSIGRHKGLRVIGASQRPAQVDKAFWSNCTEIHCGFLMYEPDQKVMAKVLGVTIDEIQSLKPLEYFHKNVRTKELKRGFVKVP
ncbi:hypothetical protein [Duganella sp. BuS-21]|uniref:hypothetical protein n=1 Tax=Duganella sp. BuS-21 TaxID=2943848 RepID=UPI0035A6E69C